MKWGGQDAIVINSRLPTYSGREKEVWSSFCSCRPALLRCYCRSSRWEPLIQRNRIVRDVFFSFAKHYACKLTIRQYGSFQHLLITFLFVVIFARYISGRRIIKINLYERINRNKNLNEWNFYSRTEYRTLYNLLYKIITIFYATHTSISYYLNLFSLRLCVFN